MTTYTKITDYAAKDSLLTGNPSKVVRGTEIDAEFTSIASADADSVKVSGLGANVATFLATPSSANLAAALTDETGTGANVFANSPTLVTPALGTPSSGTLTSCTGLPISTGISGLGTGIATALAVNVGTAGSPVVNGGALGTPSSGTLTSCTGLPISTGVSGLGANVAAFLATPSSANLAAAITDETGSGANVFATSPTLVTPALGTPSSGTLTSCTGLPISTGISGLGTGIATALAVNVGTAGSPVVNGGALGTPSSGTVTNLTGTASININGTVGATTPAAGTFTTLTSTGNATLGDAEASDTHAIKGATTLLANSASAAITVTQTGSGNAFVVEDVASDTTPFVIDSSGRTVVGAPAIFSGLFGNSAPFEVASVNVHPVQFGRFANDTFGADIQILKSRDTTPGGHTAVQSGDTIGSIYWGGSDGTNYIPTASILSQVDGTPGTNDMPGRLVFSTTADGTSSLTERMRIDSAGAVTIGGTLTANGQTVGYLNIPQNSQSAPYTLVLGDAGKHILHPSADTTARTITIPANSSVAFPIGTAVTFVNQASAGVMTIAITTDTMRLAGAGTTGSRTLAANGVATAIKLTSTEWIISGTNLT